MGPPTPRTGSKSRQPHSSLFQGPIGNKLRGNDLPGGYKCYVDRDHIVGFRRDVLILGAFAAIALAVDNVDRSLREWAFSQPLPTSTPVAMMTDVIISIGAIVIGVFMMWIASRPEKSEN